MNEATTEVEGARNPFGATVALAAIDIHADAARAARPTRAWKGVSP
jgi:hypothetical protein